MTAPMQMVLRLFVGIAISMVAHVGRAAPLDFNRDVKPILAENCFVCHGPDEGSRKAKLRLDRAAAAMSETESGAQAIVPGDPSASEVIARIDAADDDSRMPPIDSRKVLTDEQKQILRAWIEQGADYAEHWSFVKPRRIAPPDVRATTWPRNELDRYVLARLETEGLAPAPEADRPTLLRRLSLDLTGLPPTPAEMDAFLQDASPDAYERVVDRLLASPRYGERMAMWWLDGARYADSNGFQSDWERYQWRWRDWVIDAFNRNQPFDEFTIDQLAGDLRPNATLEQRIATGFCRNHRINTEGGSIAEEWHVENVIDRVDAVSNVWLGLSLGCCRCHDHKYDPFTQKDFYQLFAMFNNVPENGTGDGERPINHRPYLTAPRPDETARLAVLDADVTAAHAALVEQEKLLPQFVADWEHAFATAPPAKVWHAYQPEAVLAASGASLNLQDDGSILVTGPASANDTFVLRATLDLPRITGLRLESLPTEELPGKGPGRSENGNFVLTDLRVSLNGTPARLATARADFNQETFAIEQAIDSDAQTGWAIHPQTGIGHTATFAWEKAQEPKTPSTIAVTLDFQSPHPGHQLGRFRLSFTGVDDPHTARDIPEDVVAAVACPADQRSDEQRQRIGAYVREHHAPTVQMAQAALEAARQARDEFVATIPTVMVMEEMPEPRPAHVLIRGQYDKHGQPVTAALPAALHPAPAGAPMNRLGLAQWIVDENNPLTSRVIANRLWENYFGVGLVKTTENLGAQGEQPSNQALLDWLATELIRLKWELKAFQKTIVMSATYRQSSQVTPELVERDPENRLLARGARFRLPAEMIRDNALFAAGLLKEHLGGPSVYPYQPENIWNETTEYGNLRNYKHATDDGLYRRSLYTIWKRTAAPPNMMVFDMPSRELCTVRRGRTNTPLQALTLLNDVTYVEAARVLAERMIREGGAKPSHRIALAYRHVLGRDPSAEECAVLIQGLNARLEKFRTQPEQAEKVVSHGAAPRGVDVAVPELAAYTLTACVILNLDETVTKE
ncbi:MAG: PSD1 and planctomycete cytochrome C domain-containing protein [Planctomycetia bacterium]|nr:PSD1 and planctomycete cytochrome C domain-containing protein [Planctomycetia bacterium]